MDRARPGDTPSLAHASSETERSTSVGSAGGKTSGGQTRRLAVILVAVTLASCLAGYVQKAPSLNHAWTNGFQYTHACYTDVVALYYAEGLDHGKRPYFDHPVEYPVLTGAVMYGAMRAAQEFPSQRLSWYFFATALVLTACAVLTVLATAGLSRERATAPLMVATAPMLILAGLVNWDLLAVALAMLALLAWSRSRPLLAGLLLGLGIASKFYPIVLLVPLLVLTVRDRRLRDFLLAASACTASWLVVDLPIWLLARGFMRFFNLTATRGAGGGTVWDWLGQTGLRSVVLPHVNALSATSFAAAMTGIAVLGLRARRRPDLCQMAMLTVAALVLTSKVWSMQYVLWLLPLVALARPRWRDFLIWQAAEVVYFFVFWLYMWSLDDSSRGVGESVYLLVGIARAAALVFLCSLVVRDVLRGWDPVQEAWWPGPRGGWPAV